MFDVKIDPAEPKVAGLSVRDAHKRRTLNLLRRTALRMFLAEGYDATKAEDIAEKAGVSVRTFFRYFATKDEVVFKGQGAWALRVADIYLSLPDEMPRMDAICEAFVQAAVVMDRKSVTAYGKIVENSQILRGKAAELIARSIDEIAGAVARKQGLEEPDAASRLFAEVAVATYQSAVRDWREGNYPGRLIDVIRERFQLLHSILGNGFAETAVS